MSRTHPKILRNRKQRITRRLKPRAWPEQDQPMFAGSNIHSAMADKPQAMGCGGIGAVHLLCQKIGFADLWNPKVNVLQRHLPYHESDHVLNLASTIRAGGERIQAIELRRQDEGFLNGLGAPRIPDPTPAGDFTRRFAPKDIGDLMDAIHEARQRVWNQQPKGFLSPAVMDVDGTRAGTLGACKAGMDISSKGIWGYAPLILSLAHTQEVLCLIHRSGNAASQEGAGPWIDRAMALVQPTAPQVHLRGDPDFSFTGKFDAWDAAGGTFHFGMDASPKLVALAQSLSAAQGRGLARVPPEIKTAPRERPENVQERIVRARGFLHQRLERAPVAELEYQPGKCQKSSRMVVLRKNLSSERGAPALFDQIRCFFSMSNRRDLAWDAIVQDAHQRCNQENVIEQLKNGVNAMRVPGNALESNWAYRVRAAWAWHWKAWLGLMMPNRERGLALVQMEFRRFLAAVLWLPAQIIRAGRKIIQRIWGSNGWLKAFFATWERWRRREAS